MKQPLTPPAKSFIPGRVIYVVWPGVLRACVLLVVALLASRLAAETLKELKVQVSVGHTSISRRQFYVHLVPAGGVEVRDKSLWQTTGGAGSAEAHTFEIAFPDTPSKPIQNMHVIWADLIAHSDADTVRRLLQDPAARNDARKIIFHLNADGTDGFTLTVDQLLQHRAFWVPEFDVYVTAGDAPMPYKNHLQQIEQYKGMRILDEVHREPEASYEQFKQKWEDMGDPRYAHPVQEGPGHIVGLSWDGAIAKFGVDRGAGVWNDYGNPDHFRLWFEFANIAEGIVPYWKRQTLADGLPLITTVFERDKVRYEVEQFAYPLHGAPEHSSGDLPMVLLQRIRMTELSGQSRTIPVTLVHERTLDSGANAEISTSEKNGEMQWSDLAHRQVLLAVNSKGAKIAWTGVYENGQKAKRLDITVAVPLSGGATHEFYVTLPSPATGAEDEVALSGLDYDHARAVMLQFWSSYLAQGATFRVPEESVNELFRANLWHALRLPRRHADGKIDLPYSNFAYDQTGTPWPINQAVYVDYMLYGLRGYPKIASEEIEAIYRNNQEANGHVDGFAHWLAYTPGMLYAVGQNYLLSGNRESFEKVLPDTLKALDWSLAQIREASTDPGSTRGMVKGPLNDVTGTGYWAFNQAYLFAGIDMLGKALEKHGHPRAAECRKASAEFRLAVERSMRMAAVASPLVELRDHTWSTYVPSDAAHPGRNYEQWYPSDVDTGPAHLLRLQVLPVEGHLAEAILNDHEDNLFLHGWGLANEPVYNQQADAYLLRDDAKAAIRTFYSLMAGGFSHGVYEPVEHRWRWGQYFGPPSTDGAWFELYRNMLLREVDGNTLILGQATPRAWLEDGKQITVQHAPSWLGDVSLNVSSEAARGHVHASLQIDVRKEGGVVLLRLRHPQSKTIRSVTVDGKEWSDFDVRKEWIRISDLKGKPYSIDAFY